MAQRRSFKAGDRLRLIVEVVGADDAEFGHGGEHSHVTVRVVEGDEPFFEGMEISLRTPLAGASELPLGEHGRLPGDELHESDVSEQRDRADAERNVAAAKEVVRSRERALLESRSIEELVDLARSRGVAADARTPKADIIDALTAY